MGGVDDKPNVHGDETVSYETYQEEATFRRGFGCLLLVVSVAATCAFLFCAFVEILDECDSCSAVMPYKVGAYISGFTALAAFVAAVILLAADSLSHAPSQTESDRDPIEPIR